MVYSIVHIYVNYVSESSSDQRPVTGLDTVAQARESFHRFFIILTLSGQKIQDEYSSFKDKHTDVYFYSPCLKFKTYMSHLFKIHGTNKTVSMKCHNKNKP